MLTTNDALRALALLLTTVSLAGGLAHLLELPHKIRMDRQTYLTVQQMYRGWAFLGVAVLGALASILLLLARVGGNHGDAIPLLIAAVAIGLSLAVFFAFTYPANRVTANWTRLPEHWQRLRSRWEYSHAVNAGLYFIALLALILAIVVAYRPSP